MSYLKKPLIFLTIHTDFNVIRIPVQFIPSMSMHITLAIIRLPSQDVTNADCHLVRNELLSWHTTLRNYKLLDFTSCYFGISILFIGQA